MSIAFSSLVGKKILLKSGRYLSIKTLHVDSQTGKILGVATKKNFLPADQILFSQHYLEFSGTPEIQIRGENWKTFSVHNTSQQNLGHVSEIWIDPLGLQVTQLECRRKKWGLFPQKKILSVQEIYEVFPKKKIIVIHEENKNKIFTKEPKFTFCNS